MAVEEVCMKRNTHWIRGKKERKEGRMKETEGKGLLGANDVEDLGRGKSRNIMDNTYREAYKANER